MSKMWCLVEVVLPPGLVAIRGNALGRCHRLARLDLLACPGLTEVEGEALWDTYELRSLALPASVVLFDDPLFGSGVTSVDVSRCKRLQTFEGNSSNIQELILPVQFRGSVSLGFCVDLRRLTLGHVVMEYPQWACRPGEVRVETVDGGGWQLEVREAWIAAETAAVGSEVGRPALPR
jgi:hypothetical protein